MDTSVNAHRLLADAGWWTAVGIISPSTVAEVTASPRATGVYATSTGAGGDYALSLPPGAYTLRVYSSWSEDSSAFLSEDQPTVTVSAGDQRQVDFTGRRPISIQIRPSLYRTDIGNASGGRGDTVEVPVDVYTSDYGVGTEYERLSHNVTGARASLTFNPDVAQAVSVEGADMTVTDSTIDNDAGTVSFDVTSSDPLEGATMATVEFRLVANRSTTTHLIPDAPTTLRTTNGSVSPTDGDLPGVDTNKGELVVEEDSGTESEPNVSRVAFEYANFGGSVNLEVNGDRRTAAGFPALDGATVGGTAVSVTPPTDSVPGVVTVTSPEGGPRITSFSVGGQELMIDGVAFGPSADSEATVEFSLLTPASSGYAVGDTFTSSPSGVRMTVEPYRFSDGETNRDDSGSRVASLPEPFSPLAGAGFLPGNTNLRFNLTSVTADAEPTETVTITRHDPETGNTTNRTVERTDTAFESAAPLLPADLSPTEYSSPGTDAGYTDDKRRIRATARYPWSAVGQLRVGSATCSAVLVEDNHVLTSAHCVFDPSRPSPWASGGTTTGGAYTTFVSGANGDSAPFGSVTIASIQTYQKYVETRNATYDLAVVTLASELGSRTGTFGYRAFPPESEAYTDDRVHVTGYPNAGMAYVDTPDTQWDVIAHGRGTEFPSRASVCKGTTACHELETGGDLDQALGDGNSGGPVWDTDPDGRPVIRSLFQGSAPQYSTAVRISEDTYSDVGRMIERGNDVALAPTARATANDTSAIGGRPVELDATASADPNGDALAYEWTQVSGPQVTLAAANSPTPEFTVPSVEGVRDLEFKLTVQDGTGRSDTARVTVRVAPSAASTGTTISLEPSDRTVNPGERATYEIVVGNATDGVGAYDLEVSVDDPRVAGITAASDETGGTVQIDRADDGSAVRIAAFRGDTGDGSDAVVATVTVTGRAGGRTTSLAFTETTIADESGEQYTLAGTTGTTVRVFEPDAGAPVVGASDRAARDPDGDGIHEDVNGDGDVTPGDAAVLFDAVLAGDEAVTTNPALFDVNGDGDVTPGDATVLFNEAFG